MVMKKDSFYYPLLRCIAILLKDCFIIFRLQKQMIHLIQLQNRKEGFGSI